MRRMEGALRSSGLTLWFKVCIACSFADTPTVCGKESE